VGRCAHKSRVLEQLFCGDCFHVAGPCVRSTLMLLDVLLAWCMSHSSDVADRQQFALRQMVLVVMMTGVKQVRLWSMQ
jgi:hypothetical protein